LNSDQRPSCLFTKSNSSLFFLTYFFAILLRFNLKLRMAGLKRITEKEFEKVLTQNSASTTPRPESKASNDADQLESSEETENETYDEDDEPRSEQSTGFLPYGLFCPWPSFSLALTLFAR